ncbi:MAG: DUF808 domain-containing protein [Pseudomonadota bacterium]
MSGGFLALLDDIAALSKVAASQLDDVSALATQAGTKSFGVVIDDAAVTPKFVEGLPAARELGVVWRIAKGSFFNKLVILAPIALLIEAFAPWLLAPILLVGGFYLSFEGAEKVLHALHVVEHEDDKHAKETAVKDGKLEDNRVREALKTDFILSAEITAISLAAIQTDSFVMKAIALVLVVSAITVFVYGAVAVIIRADDWGLHLHNHGRTEFGRKFGRNLVEAMPKIVSVIGIIGTAAMLWVGGSIVVHSLKEMGAPQLYKLIHNAADAVGSVTGPLAGLFNWATTATLDATLGLALGVVIVGLMTILPISKHKAPETKKAKT